MIFVAPLDYNPTTDLPFLLPNERETQQKPVSSASFDPVESICPSIPLVFGSEDGLPLGP